MASLLLERVVSSKFNVKYKQIGLFEIFSDQ